MDLKVAPDNQKVYKVSPDKETELDELVIKVNNLVRNIFYSAYQEKDYKKALRNATELKDIINDEIALYEHALNN